MVDLVRRNLRDHIPVVLAQFLFSDSQCRHCHRHTWDQRDRLDAADNYPGVVAQESLAQKSPHGGLYLARTCDDIGTKRASGAPDHDLEGRRHGGWGPFVGD